MTKKKYNLDNILVIGDQHEPFSRKGYLEFCKAQQEKYNCGTIVMIGDVIDNHYSSYHETDPDGLGAGQELENAIRRIKKWYEAFPEAKVCIGNHDALITRKAMTAGLAAKWIRDYAEVLGTPGWDFKIEHKIHNVLFTHGTGTTGEKAAYNKAIQRRISVVQGHLHTQSSIIWNVSEVDRIFGMQTGCGVNEDAYAMAYARNFPKKFIVSCAVILDKGTQPITIPMPLGNRIKNVRRISKKVRS